MRGSEEAAPKESTMIVRTNKTADLRTSTLGSVVAHQNALQASTTPHVEIRITTDGPTWRATTRSAARARAAELLADERLMGRLYGDAEPPRAGQGLRVAYLTFVDGLGRRTEAGVVRL